MTETLQDQPSSYFDEHGRTKPFGLSHPANRISRRYFKLEQPEINYGAIYDRISRHLGKPATLSCERFEERATGILKELQLNPAISNITRGVHLPFFLPKAAHPDVGEATEQHYVPAVGSAFSEMFPEYRFDNHNKTELRGMLRVHPDSRHDRLIARMRDTDVVGFYFPCLSEYSVPAAFEQMATLPDNLILAGGYDTCAVLTGSPGLLQRREGYPNMLWLAAMQPEREDVGYYFEAYGLNLTFNKRTHFGQVSEYWASALVALG